MDLVLKELDGAILISDDVLCSTLKTFEMKILPCFSHDPFSDEYKQEQFKIYERIAGKSYNPINEVDEKWDAVLFLKVFIIAQTIKN